MDDQLVEAESTHKQIHHYAQKEDIDSRLGRIIGPKYTDYRKRWDEAGSFKTMPDFPLFLVMELINICNYQCPSCVHGYKDLRKAYQQGKAQEMSWELYEKIILEAEQYNCPSLCMNNIGEPTLIKDLIKKIEFARDHGFIDIHFNTNGLLLDRFLDERLFESGLTRLMFSLDAFSEETYKKVRVGGDFYKVMKNIDKFMEMREKGNYKLPIMRTTLVKSSLNEHEIEPFINFWTNKADYVSVQEFISPSPGDERFDTLFADSRVINETPHCPQPWQYMSIKPNGDTAPCCAMFSEKIKTGNANTQSLKEIWDSRYASFLRDIHKSGDYHKDETCKNCLENSVLKK